jgi:hypothetical protein
MASHGNGRELLASHGNGRMLLTLLTVWVVATLVTVRGKGTHIWIRTENFAVQLRVPPASGWSFRTTAHPSTQISTFYRCNKSKALALR